MHVWNYVLRLVLLLVLSTALPLASGAQERPAMPTCADFVSLTPDHQVTLAYGYLEGVQAALDKDPADILVPPSDPQHPMWWTLPKLEEKDIFANLAQKVASHCKAAGPKKLLLSAFLALAVQKEGWPSIGISYDDTKTDPWKRFLGKSVSCGAYNASQPATRQAMIYGYWLGTQALRLGLKTNVENHMLSPSKLTVVAVREEVDQKCRDGATWREVLWLTTTELAVKSGSGPSSKK